MELFMLYFAQRYLLFTPRLVLIALLLATPVRSAALADDSAAMPAVVTGGTYVIHLPGIGGLMRIDRLLTGGLASGGLEAEIRVYDWTGELRGLRALGAIERNRLEAGKVAQLIVDRLRADPDARIIITCHSGGSGIAVWALESLPEHVQIDTLVMLAPALSPGYDLTGALRRVKTSAYSFNSQYDPILGAGTRAFGTIDRIMTYAAGRVGFETPERADLEQYAKLVQIPYDRRFMAFGNIGDHIGPMMPRFAARIIAPLLLTGELPQPTTQPANQPATAPATADR
jgi:alpha-beta hydrolase superfamily lysophospholipase